MHAPLLPRWVRKMFRDELHHETLAFFRNVPIFHGLSGRQLARVMVSMQRRYYKIGEVVFVEGEIGKAVFVLKSGQVELSRQLSDGTRRTLASLLPGQMFGEMALLEQMSRTAT